MLLKQIEGIEPEAQALARPIVATGVDGNTDVVEDGKSGRIVPPEDPAALARAILEVFDGAAVFGMVLHAGEREAAAPLQDDENAVPAMLSSAQ